jgi:Ca2+-binding RTX toxin-like protein
MNVLNRPLAVRCGAGAGTRWLTNLVIVSGLVMGGLATSAQAARSAWSVAINHRTLTVTGNAASNALALRLRAHHPNTLQIDVGDNGSADFQVQRHQFDRIRVNGAGGNDLIRIDESHGAFTTTTPTQIDGGAGDDTIIGGSGAETLIGGTGSDTIDGGPGADHIQLGAGDDRVVWNPGDGSDVVDGGDGGDSIAFNGSVASEQFHVSPNGTHARLTRDVGAITMDLVAIEQVDVASVGGNDTLTVDDLTGTGVTTVNNDLAATLGGTTPGAGVDQTIINGTDGPDRIVAAGTAGSASVTGLAATVNIVHADATRDELGINALGGDDRFDGTALRPDTLKLGVDGGTGDDTLLGSPRADVLRGGDGSDFVVGNRGDDVVLLGAGDDRFVWDPGDGSDVVEGQDGHDAMTFNAANASEHFDVSANGRRVRFTRDVGNVVMDVNGLEEIDVNALGGSDLLNVNDVSGTDLTEIQADLAGNQGGDDGSADEVIVNGTDRDDTITASGSAGKVRVTGLAATVDIADANAVQDELAINGLGGDDVIDGSGLTADAIRFHADGGDGDDVLLGGAGDDVLIGGPGQDVLDGGPGNNELIQ